MGNATATYVVHNETHHVATLSCTVKQDGYNNNEGVYVQPSMVTTSINIGPKSRGTLTAKRNAPGSVHADNVVRFGDGAAVEYGCGIADHDETMFGFIMCLS